MRRLITPDEIRALDDPNGAFARGEAALWRATTEAPEPVDNGRIVRYCISDSSIARDGHTIATGGWVLDNYLRNPVVLWAHDGSEPPIGRIVEIGAVGDRLMANIEYAERDVYPFADTVFQMVRGGYLNATSVSWLPLEWKFSTDRGRPGGIDFKRQELLEVSQVPVPSLPSALVAARAAGIDTGPLYVWAEKLLDDGNTVLVPRAELEELRRAAKMPAPKGAAHTTPEPPARPNNERAIAALLKRDLYDCGWLAQILQSLDCLQECAEWEAAAEGDNSPIPGQIKNVVNALGKILVDMTQEEVAELLAGDEMDDGEMTDAVRAVRAIAAIMRAAEGRGTVTLRLDGTPELLGLIRVGRVLSAENERCLRAVEAHAVEHAEMVRAAIDTMTAAEPDADDAEQRAVAERQRRARAAKYKLEISPAT